MLVIELSFFGANILNVFDGGWVPLAVGGLVFVVMRTWYRGRREVGRHMGAQSVPLSVLLTSLEKDPPVRTPGTAVFLAGRAEGTPAVLLHHLRLNRALAEQVVLVTVAVEERAHVPVRDRVERTELSDGFSRVLLRHGFMDDVDIPAALGALETEGIRIDPDAVTYYLGRQTLRVLPRSEAPESGLSRWQAHLFAALMRNEGRPHEAFNLPDNCVVELGVQLKVCRGRIRWRGRARP